MSAPSDKILSAEDYERIVKDPKVRRAAAKDSLRLFFGIYLRHFIEYPIAKFHEEMISLLEDDDARLLAIMAFRSSAKSTIASLAYVLWAILGRQKKKHILILSQTIPQARLLLSHIKREYESNPLLRADLGPFESDEAVWNSSSIVIPKYGARITAASVEQNVRGLRHGAHRPDLVIFDDIESLESVRTREGRNKTFTWVVSDVIPAAADKAKFVFLGTMAHPDSVLMRIRDKIAAGLLKGIFRYWPIVDGSGVIAWPSRFPDMDAIEALKRGSPSQTAFQREYMLVEAPEGDPVILRDWIRYYDELPDLASEEVEAILVSVDPAIMDEQRNNCTAIVTGVLVGTGEKQRIYILPPVINERHRYHTALERIKQVYSRAPSWPMKKLLIEGVAAQRIYYEVLRQEGYNAVFVIPNGSKRERLTQTTHMIQSSRILFPRKGAEELIEQIVGFESEGNDDLADAFSQLVIHCITNEQGRARSGRR